MRPKFLFLYTELAGYFLACIKQLVDSHQAEVHIIRWPVNKEAPFQFNIPAGVKLYDKQIFSRSELISLAHKIQPNLVFCSGWMDKDYLAVARSFKKHLPVVIGMDNHWNGALKQQLARIVSPFILKRVFTHAFVAGAPQHLYARKLSFDDEHILQGYYSADVPYFDQCYKQFRQQKAGNFPKRFLYVGRYVPEKGLHLLWQAFTELHHEMPNEWELWCVGTGPLQHSAVQHPNIRHFGFVQPGGMSEFIGKTGVFVLPSHFEPWGVVVHEYAAAGIPLLCSHKVGAASAFVKDGLNGFQFEGGSVISLKNALKQIMESTDETLVQMGDESNALAFQNTPSVWAEKLMKLVAPERSNKSA